ncbi:MAG: RNA methyltransferase [Deltaproteobacteria bacterium]
MAAGSKGRNPSFGLDLALVHYPVSNKNREIIGSAVTNLDLHDIARAGRTFGVENFYIVTPFSDQQQLVSELLAHWLHGPGGAANGLRKEALEIIRVLDDLEAVVDRVAAKRGRRPTVLATCARPQAKCRSFAETREALYGGENFLILFGTAWGLAPKVLAMADGLLPPIRGEGEYNHLSVRSAAAIVLDRLLGER